MSEETLLHAEALRLVRAGALLLDVGRLRIGVGEHWALTGPNGSGTSTLLACLAGVKSPAEGVVRKGPGVRIAYLSQSDGARHGTIGDAIAGALQPLHDLEHELRDEERRWAEDPGSYDRHTALLERFEHLGGYRAEAMLERDLAGLGVHDLDRDRPVSSLSGGQRRRLELALAWTPTPDLLILDDPTQHLDLEARTYLSERLEDAPCAWLVATHDRSLIRCAGAGVLQIAEGRLRVRPRHAEQHAKPDAAPVASRAREGRQSERARPALMARHLTVTLGGGRVLDDVGLRVMPGERVAVTGRNGSGKSTLLALLASARASDDPRAVRHYAAETKLFYSDQHARGLDPRRTPFEALSQWVFPDRARQLLGWMELAREAWARPAASLSDGERTRASLALAIAREANLWILDEPEAHLDLAGIERLESIFDDRSLTIVIASHDRVLIERTADRVLHLEGGHLSEDRSWAGEPRPFAHDETATKRGAREGPPDATVTTGVAGENARGVDARREALEVERGDVEERLLDPTSLTERERVRLERRHRTLLDELSASYDAQFPAAAPRVRVREAGLTFGASVAGDALVIEGPPGATGHVTRRGPIAHVTVRAAADADLLPWARVAWIRAATRLAFYLLGVQAVQTFSTATLVDAGLTSAGDGWWLVDRAEFEASERWIRDENPPRSRASAASKALSPEGDPLGSPDAEDPP